MMAKSVFAVSSIGVTHAWYSMIGYVPNGEKYGNAPIYWPAIGHTIACSQENGFGEGYTEIDMAAYPMPTCGQTSYDQKNNAFGMAIKEQFATGGWTDDSWKAICVLDSDNDGQTNGEEMGDPNCVWKPGDVPCRTDMASLSLPGDPTSLVAVVSTVCDGVGASGTAGGGDPSDHSSHDHSHGHGHEDDDHGGAHFASALFAAIVAAFFV